MDNNKKKTSSAYFAQKRKEMNIPERFCECCGKKLERWYNAKLERYEDWRSYLGKRFCSPSCAATISAKERREALEAKYRECKEVEGLFVDMDGNFRYRGKQKKVNKPTNKFGKKMTARIDILVNGKAQYFQASRLVASAWCHEYEDDAYILYKDGDIHNISSDNLRIVNQTTFDKYRGRGLTPGRGSDNYQHQLKKARVIAEEANAVLKYFEDRDMSLVNKHVKEYLYNELEDYCINTIHLGRLDAMEKTGEAIALMYDMLISGHVVHNMERWCKELLLRYKKQGSFGVMGNTPKHIEMIASNVNIEELGRKYNLTHFKK